VTRLIEQRAVPNRREGEASLTAMLEDGRAVYIENGPGAAARKALARAHGVFVISPRSSLAEIERAVSGGLVRPYEAMVDEARDELGHERFDAQLTEGAASSWADGVEAALRYVESIAVPPGPAPRSASPPGPPVQRVAGGGKLTIRQREVLVLLAQGLSNKEIAATLGLTPKSVMHHTTAIYQSTGARGRSEATAWAFRTGLAG
jgi:DNA-binding NarL/FixJ family response regulator